MTDDDRGFIGNLRGLANDWVATKRKTFTRYVEA